MRGSFFRALARLVFALGISGALGIFGTPSAQAQTCVKYWSHFQTNSVPRSPDWNTNPNILWDVAPWSTIQPDGFAIAKYLTPAPISSSVKTIKQARS